jgi:uncharacterized membrane protein
MRALFASIIVFVALSVVLLPLDLRFQREQAAERSRNEAESAAWRARIARGEIEAPRVPRYPTAAEAEAYRAAHAGARR